MQKQKKKRYKIQLNRKTVRNLSMQVMHGIVGGVTDPTYVTRCEICSESTWPECP